MITRPRSPNYPSVDLGEAVERVKAIYAKEGRSAFVPEIAAEALGYRSFSGPVRSLFASLKQYGLIDQKKGRDARLSPRALTLALRTEASREYREALRDAAMEPPLFREILEERGGGSDESLRHYLIVERNFTDEGARRAIQVFRDTLTLIGEEQPDLTPRQDEGLRDGRQRPMSAPAAVSPDHPAPSETVPGNRVRVPIRLKGGKHTVIIELPETMDSEAWGQMIKILDAYKLGYVSDEAPDPKLLQAATEQSEDMRGDTGRDIEGALHSLPSPLLG